MKNIAKFRFFIFSISVLFVPFGYGQAINNDSADVLFPVKPAIAVAVEGRQTPLPVPSIAIPAFSPENSKYPPRKVNPRGIEPPQTLPPYGKAVWPVCPNGLCDLN